MKIRASLVVKLIFSFGLLSLVVMGAIVSSINIKMRSDILRTMRDDYLQLVQARAAQISILIEKLEWQLKSTILDPDFHSSDRAIVESAVLRVKSGLSKEVYGSIFAWLDGTSFSDLRARTNLSKEDYFLQIERGADFAVGKLAISYNLGIPIVILAQSVRDGEGKLQGILCYQVKLSTLSAVAEEIRAKKSGYGTLIDARGLVIANRDEITVLELVLPKADESGYKGLSALGSRMIREDSGSGEWLDNWGTRYSTYFAKIAGGFRLAHSHIRAEGGNGRVDKRHPEFLPHPHRLGPCSDYSHFLRHRPFGY